MDQLNPLSFQIKTFGCKVNTYDSGLLEKRFLQKGWSAETSKESNSSSSVFVLNTCAVTAEATKEAAREARRIKAKHPFGLVVVTGCGAQVDTETFAEIPGVDLVVANSHKGELEQLIEDHYKGKLTSKVFKSNIFKKEDLEAGGGLKASHSRAFLKIQDGCNSFCTFCVIPFARGKSRSISVPNLVHRVQDLYNQGFREVVLTGVHIGDFEEASLRLEDLVETLLAKTKMPRFRISSLEPVELSDRLLKLYVQEPRLCPHFHLSIQSANTRVLHAMKRTYSAEAVSDCFDRIHEALPNCYVGMDVIVGFPGETEDEFLETSSRLEQAQWNRIHVFPYSIRPGTYAARLKDHLAPLVIKERAVRLRTLSQERAYERAKTHVGQVKRGLLLKGPSSSEDLNAPLKFLTSDYLSVVVPRADFKSDLTSAAFESEWSIRLDQILPERRPGLDPIFQGSVVI